MATTPQFSEEELPVVAAEEPVALVRVEPGEEPRSISDDPAMGLIPVQVDVTVPVSDFRVRDVLTLAPGAIIESRWNHSDDLPLSAGDVQLAWCEFEVIDMELGVRITRLA